MLERNTRRSVWTMFSLGLAVVLLCSGCSGGGSSGGGTAASSVPEAPPAESAPASAALASGNISTGSGLSFTGGFIETADSAVPRPLMTAAQIQAMLPATRGLFTFPAPYNTAGVRLTNATDCAGNDCVESTGYSYWRNTNNHVGSDIMYIFLGLSLNRGGGGPTLFSYNKTTDEVTNMGPLFFSTDPLAWATGEMWYFSATQPTKLYVFQSGSGTKLLRYDVVTKQTETVFDVAPNYGSDKYIWQPHSSNDDKVHTVTLRSTAGGEMLGCLAFNENTQQFTYKPKLGDFDECFVDKSGQWMVSLENVDGVNAHDNRIINLQTGAESVLLDQDGAAAHLDMGFGTMVGEDNWNALPGAARLYTLGGTPIAGPVVYHTTDWGLGLGHPSWQNASASTPLEQQYACNSSTSNANLPRGNEITCFGMNASKKVLVVAPVMTSFAASGGGADDYSKTPKGNTDITGGYFIWTSNMTSARQDAFIVKVPGQLLSGS
jgi:hypothetical protein